MRYNEIIIHFQFGGLMINHFEKIKAVIFGHAIGDALGVPVEFATREELTNSPVTKMEGYGTYPMPKGCWSDDTSMSIAALDSLGTGTIDWNEMMSNFCKWYFEDQYTPTGEMFDVGNTCSIAIENYKNNNLPAIACGLTNERSNGNGSLMRINPFVLFGFAKKFSTDEIVEFIHTASSLTHAHERSKVGCGIYCFVLKSLLEKPNKTSVVLGISKASNYYKTNPEYSHYTKLFSFSNINNCIKTKKEEISSSGYIVSTLEAAIWCLLTTNTYRECVLKAINLGDDTDTIAAVAGGLAGALYGFNSIPIQWITTIKKKDYIEYLCAKASCNWQGTSFHKLIKTNSLVNCFSTKELNKFNFSHIPDFFFITNIIDEVYCQAVPCWITKKEKCISFSAEPNRIYIDAKIFYTLKISTLYNHSTNKLKDSSKASQIIHAKHKELEKIYKKRQQKKDEQKIKNMYAEAYELAVINNDKKTMKEIEFVFGCDPRSNKGNIKTSSIKNISNPKPCIGGKVSPK